MAKIVKTVCESCGGSGLYSGMMERDGHLVVCITCNGTGCEEVQYTPFVKQRRIRGVKSVRLSRGTFIADGVGAYGKEVSYKEFLQGKLRYR